MFNSNWRARCHGCLVKAKFAYVAETIEQTKAVQVDISGIILKDLQLYCHCK